MTCGGLGSHTPMQLALGEKPPWTVGLVDLAPLLIQELPDPAFLRGNVFQIIEAVQEQVAQIGDIRLALHP